MAGALLYFDFFSAVVGFFGQPAATDVAFAAACAFVSAADAPVAEETVTFMNLAFVVSRRLPTPACQFAVSGTGVPVVVLVVELKGGLVGQADQFECGTEPPGDEVTRVRPQSLDGCRSENLRRAQTRLRLAVGIQHSARAWLHLPLIRSRAPQPLTQGDPDTSAYSSWAP